MLMLYGHIYASGHSSMTCLIRILLICLVLPAVARAADAADDLYRAQAIVTGKGEKNRQLGFRDCLDRVLVRVSGDRRLLAKPEITALRDRAGDLVASFTYRDRLEGVPIHDEQGSYDRPHDLTCTFDRGKLDAVLAGLGSRPWLAERPTVVPLLAVERGEKHFVLTADGGGDPAMHMSFAAAAEPLAMTIALPDTAEIAAAGLGHENLWQAGQGPLEGVAKASGGRTRHRRRDLGVQDLEILLSEVSREALVAKRRAVAAGQVCAMALAARGVVPLLGRLVWSDADLGWVADWRISFKGRIYDWQVRGVSFDEAFRVAMRGAAQVLSGNGQP